MRTERLTFHLWFILSETPLLPPQLSMWCHHLWTPDPRLSMRPFSSWTPILLFASQSPFQKPFDLSACSGFVVCDLSPLTPWPCRSTVACTSASLSIGCPQQGSRLGSLCPWNPLGLWLERWSIGKLSWAAEERIMVRAGREGEDVDGWKTTTGGKREEDLLRSEWENERARGRVQMRPGRQDRKGQWHQRREI